MKPINSGGGVLGMRHKRTGPALATEIPYAAVAQLVEHLIAIQKVAGSNPVSRSMWP